MRRESGRNRSAEPLDRAVGRLLGFSDGEESDREPLPIGLAGYLELVDWSGRAVAAGKRGSIP